MFARMLRRPRSSCFLFGPRGVGKSTWIGRHFADAPLYDLLNTTEALRLTREPATVIDRRQVARAVDAPSSDSSSWASRK